MITGLHHIGLSVRDVDAAVAFYCQQQAFEVHERFDLEDTPTNRAHLQLDQASAKIAFLTGSLGCLELFEFAESEQETSLDRSVYTAGIRHICLQTEISDGLFDGLVEAGASFHARPSGLGTGNSYVYIRDPEGNLLEVEGTPWAPASVQKPWFAHVALVSPDIHRLIGFYEQITGVQNHHRGTFGPNQLFDTVGNLKDARFHGGWIRLRNAELEFWHYLNPQTTPKARAVASDIGWNHLCLESDDIEADYERLKALGVELHAPPSDMASAFVFFGRDPDGNIFEVLQPKTTAKITVASMLADEQGQAVAQARIAYRQAFEAPAKAG